MVPVNIWNAELLETNLLFRQIDSPRYGLFLLELWVIVTENKSLAHKEENKIAPGWWKMIGLEGGAFILLR
jgi:hypothetical protein